MTYLAQAVRRATNASVGRISMEQLLDSARADSLSMEELFDEHDQLVVLHDGLKAAVISFEGLVDPTEREYRALRTQISSQLRLVGVGQEGIEEIYPSMEDRNTAWESFKAFLERLWKMITDLAKKAWAYITAALKRSTEGEKLAMARLTFLLKRGLPLARDGMTISDSVQVTPAHAYLFAPPSMEVAGGPSKPDEKIRTVWRRAPMLTNPEHLLTNVAAFVKARDGFEVGYVEHIRNQIGKVIEALRAGSRVPTTDLSGLVPVQAAINDAVRELSPEGLLRAMGGGKNPIPLIFDRALLVEGVGAAAVNWDDAHAVVEHMNGVGVDVVQVKVDLDPSKLGTFPAMRWTELTTTLNKAVDLIDTNHSSDQRKRWNALQDEVSKLEFHTAYLRKRAQTLTDVNPGVAAIIELTYRFYQYALKWSTAPYRKMGALNIMVVNSMIAMVNTQLANYKDVQGFQSLDSDAAGDAGTRGWM